MSAIEALRGRIPDFAKDLKLNLQTVLGESSLNDAQKWGVAVAAAAATGHDELQTAVLEDAKTHTIDAVIEDARAAAALMAMNNVFYRFRHFMSEGSDDYAKLPAKLRMQRIARPEAEKVDFELMCLAVSAMNGCEACVRSHEKVVRDGGLTAQHVQDAVRIASTVAGVATALRAAG
ncbi:MAG: carboxymuconolactone decarboxylase family protein [Myxococcales bacterium]|nr:carboxymuconolactone decarboxylase family protein [Myxococcales bacterium]